MEFTFVGGNLGLDLAGTVGARRSRLVELLPTPVDLARWTVAANLLDTEPAVTEADFTAAQELREAVYRLAIAAREGTAYDATDLAVLNRAAEPAPPTLRLDGPGTLARTGGVRAALAAAARASAELLGGPDAARVRECEAGDCTRLYVDASHRGTRRWCDMRGCGNRAKASAYRARHKPA
ncbi:ABATE domain-containing protein [Spirillospora sp. NPDC052269]